MEYEGSHLYSDIWDWFGMTIVVTKDNKTHGEQEYWELTWEAQD